MSGNKKWSGPKIGSTYPTSDGLPYVDLESGKKGVVYEDKDTGEKTYVETGEAEVDVSKIKGDRPSGSGGSKPVEKSPSPPTDKYEQDKTVTKEELLTKGQQQVESIQPNLLYQIDGIMMSGSQTKRHLKTRYEKLESSLELYPSNMKFYKTSSGILKPAWTSSQAVDWGKQHLKFDDPTTEKIESFSWTELKKQQPSLYLHYDKGSFFVKDNPVKWQKEQDKKHDWWDVGYQATKFYGWTAGQMERFYELVQGHPQTSEEFMEEYRDPFGYHHGRLETLHATEHYSMTQKVEAGDWGGVASDVFTKTPVGLVGTYGMGYGMGALKASTLGAAKVFSVGKHVATVSKVTSAGVTAGFAVPAAYSISQTGLDTRALSRMGMTLPIYGAVFQSGYSAGLTKGSSAYIDRLIGTGKKGFTRVKETIPSSLRIGHKWEKFVSRNYFKPKSGLTFKQELSLGMSRVRSNLPEYLKVKPKWKKFVYKQGPTLGQEVHASIWKAKQMIPSSLRIKPKWETFLFKQGHHQADIKASLSKYRRSIFIRPEETPFLPSHIKTTTVDIGQNLLFTQARDKSFISLTVFKKKGDYVYTKTQSAFKTYDTYKDIVPSVSGEKRIGIHRTVEIPELSKGDVIATKTYGVSAKLNVLDFKISKIETSKSISFSKQIGGDVGLPGKYGFKTVKLPTFELTSTTGYSGNIRFTDIGIAKAPNLSSVLEGSTSTATKFGDTGLKGSGGNVFGSYPGQASYPQLPQFVSPRHMLTSIDDVSYISNYWSGVAPSITKQSLTPLSIQGLLNIQSTSLDLSPMSIQGMSSISLQKITQAQNQSLIQNNLSMQSQIQQSAQLQQSVQSQQLKQITLQKNVSALVTRVTPVTTTVTTVINPRPPNVTPGKPVFPIVPIDTDYYYKKKPKKKYKYMDTGYRFRMHKTPTVSSFIPKKVKKMLRR